MVQEIASASINPLVITDDHCSASMNLSRSKLVQRALQGHQLNLIDLREWDAMAVTLPAAATGTYLGLVTGSYGVNPPLVQAGDLKAAGATSRRGRIVVPLPDHYDDGSGIQIRCNVGMTTTVADTTATIDVECFQLNSDGTLSADLCTTAAQSMNSLTFANKDFVITPTALVPGNRLDIRVTMTVTDAAGVTAVIGTLRELILRCGLKP